MERFDLLPGKGASDRNTQFPNQPSGVHWARPIRKSDEIGGGGSLVGNGNYLAQLSIDESTFDATFKQLPTGYQLLAFETGKLGDVLVSAYDKDGKGHLLYWDGFTEQWNEIIQIDKAPLALHPYKGGWVYFVDGVLYFTDGRNIEQIASMSKRKMGQNPSVTGFNGIKSIDDKIYLACVGDGLTIPTGVYIFNGSGFTLVKCMIGSTQYATPYTIGIKNSTQISSIFSNTFSVEVGCYGSLNRLSDYTASSTTTKYRSMMLKIDLKQETKIGEVWLNLQAGSNAIQTLEQEDP